MSAPHVIADDDPRLPTMADVERYVTDPKSRIGGYQWDELSTGSHDALLHLAREAARHALAQAPILTNAEKRAIWLDGCLSGQQVIAWADTKSAESQARFRFPDPAPAPVEYTLGGETFTVINGIRKIRRFGHWHDLEDSERAALKALAAGL